MSRADDPRIPITSIIFGYGPMLPLLAAGLGTWLLGGEGSLLAMRLAIIWGALILVYIAGVRRGFGFAADRASTPVEIMVSLGYFVLGGLSLLVPSAGLALLLLILGYALAAVLDRRAALSGNAPRHFARLRPTQLLLGMVGLAACWAWLHF